MTNTIIFTDTVVSGVAHTFSAAGDTLTVTRGTTFGSADDRVFDTTLAFIKASFLGDVVSDGGLALRGSDGSVVIGEDGSLTSFDTNRSTAALFMEGTRGAVTNHGLIQEVDGWAIRFQRDGELVNTGTIEAFTPVIFMTGSGGFAPALVNSGLILANETKFDPPGPGYGNAVTSSQPFSEIVNLAGGQIVALNEGRNAVELRDGAIASTVTNAGDIVSARSVAIDYAGLTPGGTSRTDNSGLIRGDGIAFSAGATLDTLVNSGEIHGEVFLGAGNDLFWNDGGHVADVVFGGTGDDIYRLTGHTNVTLEEAAGEGDDRVETDQHYALADNFEVLTLLGAGDLNGTGTNAQNTLNGNAGANILQARGSRDVVDAGAGADSIDAGRGDDVAMGGDGDDSVMGRAGRDILDGGEGDDMLFGGLGDDTMTGGDGRDTLKGGQGADELSGGSGADTFVYTRPSDSVFGGANDAITDFTAGDDLLDLSALSQDTLALNIGGSFTGGGQASVLLSVTGSGNTRVFIDTDGDGAADMRVLLLASAGLTEADFVL